MKKLLVLTIVLLLAFLSGCTGATATENNDNDNSNLISEESIKESIGQAIEKEDETVEIETVEEAIDVDLTKLSSTMVYAEVYNIVNYPDDYEGKTIKLKGSYFGTFVEESGQYFHAVVIADAIGCCAQGLDFVITGAGDNFVYPNEGDEIEMIGVIESYVDEGTTYYRIRTEGLTIV